jgi:adenylate cyclase
MLGPAQPQAKSHMSGLKMPHERTVRIVTGCVMFAYATCHFLSHATGMGGLEAMERIGRGIILAPWRTYAGQTLLFGSLFVHGTLGLKALIRRRHLRMPAIEAVQLVLGLTIPLLLIPHAANVRLGSALFGLDDSYYRLIYQYWITTAVTGLPRQFLLMLAIWVHGCIGLHMYLRLRGWYRRRLAWLAGVAILIPFLAILGINNAGWYATVRADTEPGFSARNGPPPPGTADARNRAELEAVWDWLCVGYLGLVIGALGYRELRRLRAYRKVVRVAYPERSPVTVPVGFTVLEASRWAGIPHTSICGGKARCSTCRVRITRGEDGLPPPSDLERETLDRVKAPPHVRLACQLRPPHDVFVVPLIPAVTTPRGMRIAVDGGAEVTATALCVDLRDSTALAAGKLPYDSLFIVDRYVQCASAAITAHGGYITSIAGDGIMSVFGIDGDARRGAEGALAAVRAIWEGLDRLSDELAADLTGRMRFGIGVHSGKSVLGSIVLSGTPSLQFLGDTGNVAARLQDLSKELAATAVVSQEVFATAGRGEPPGVPLTDATVRGRGGAALRVAAIKRLDELPAAAPRGFARAG